MKDYKFESQSVVIFSPVPTHIFYINTFFVKNNILYYYFLVLQQVIFS